MSTNADCLFCKIIAGEIPSEKLYSDVQVVAFRDITPVAPTHILIVPVLHITDAFALELNHGDVLAAMFVASQTIARAEGVSSSGYRLVFNVGDDAGNSVAHLHMHLIGGRQIAWPPG
jgi:histidine triad (HIT) family protein